MAGLRIGWLATRDRELLARCAAFKDYTTICSAAPSEVLALIGLRARDVVLARSRGIVVANLEAPGRFRRHLGRPVQLGPAAGRFGRLSALDRARRVPSTTGPPKLVEAEGVLLLPGSQFGFGGNHFRLGFGRTDLPVALERLEAFAARTLR